MDTTSLLERHEKLERLRTILREAVTRYRNEYMDTEEREVLWNRIVRLRRQLESRV